MALKTPATLLGVLVAAFTAAVAAFPAAVSAAPAAPWLEDIRTRAEAEAKGSPGAAVSEDDLKTIKRKLDFGEARPSDELDMLRRHIARRAASTRLGASGEEMAACRLAPIGVDALTLRDVASALAREEDPARRRRIASSAMAEGARLYPIAQYAWLAESRERARLLGQSHGGFRSRDEAAILAMADGARHVFHETEEAFRSLAAAVAKEELGGAAPELSDIPWLLYAPLRDSLDTARNRAAVDETCKGLGLPALPEGVLQRDGPGDGGLGPHLVLQDPPRQLVLTYPESGGTGGLRDMLRGQGLALSYTTTRPEASFEPRWLGDDGVRDAYGRLLESLAADPSWIDARLALPADARARYLRAVAWARLLEARRHAAMVLFEAELVDPRVATQSVWSLLHEQALGIPIPYDASTLSIEDMARGAAASFDALLLAARMQRALEGPPGMSAGPWWKDPRATRKLQDGLRQAGFESSAELRDRFRGQRDDARTYVEQLLATAKAAGHGAP